MLEKIDEPIEVSVNFQGQRVAPAFFKWRGRTYRVEKVNLVHQERDGQDRVFHFSVSDRANYFRLAFFTRDLSWRIRELFYEG